MEFLPFTYGKKKKEATMYKQQPPSHLHPSQSMNYSQRIIQSRQFNLQWKRINESLEPLYRQHLIHKNNPISSLPNYPK